MSQSATDMASVAHAANAMIEAVVANDYERLHKEARFFEGRPRGVMLLATEMWVQALLEIKGVHGDFTAAFMDDGGHIVCAEDVPHARLVLDVLEAVAESDWRRLIQVWVSADEQLAVAASMQILQELGVSAREAVAARRN